MDFLNQKKKIAKTISLHLPNYSFDTEFETIDPLAEFAIESVFDEVINYCNFNDHNEVPDQLLNTMSLMAIDYLNSISSTAGKSDQEIEDGSIKSVKEGDVTVTRLSLAEQLKIIASIPSPIGNYKRNLNGFRRLKR